jgi:hypothetical protein
MGRHPAAAAIFAIRCAARLPKRSDRTLTRLRQTTSHMSEKEGHFENGRWVEEPEAEPETEQIPIESGPAPESGASAEDLLAEASQSVRKAVDDVVKATRHLFGTPEGRDHIERSARKAGSDLEKAINDAAESARKTLERR